MLGFSEHENMHSTEQICGPNMVVLILYIPDFLSIDEPGFGVLRHDAHPMKAVFLRGSHQLYLSFTQKHP